MAFAVDDHKDFGFSRQAPQPQPNPTAMKTFVIRDAFNIHWISEESANKAVGLASTRSFLGSAQEMLKQANLRRSIPDTMKTIAANERDIETLVGQIESKLFAGHKAARAALASSKASVQSNIDSISALKSDAYAPEVRAAFKAMSLADAQTA